MKHPQKFFDRDVIKVVRSLLYRVGQSRLAPKVITSRFNFPIPVPRVQSLVSTEIVQLFCRASKLSLRIFCGSTKKRKTVEVFLQRLFTNMRSST